MNSIAIKLALFITSLIFVACGADHTSSRSETSTESTSDENYDQDLAQLEAEFEVILKNSPLSNEEKAEARIQFGEQDSAKIEFIKSMKSQGFSACVDCPPFPPIELGRWLGKNVLRTDLAGEAIGNWWYGNN